MRIVTRLQFSGHWTAVDDATYDGPDCSIGAGPTEEAAIDDLMAQVDERQAELAEAISIDQRDHASPWS